MTKNDTAEQTTLVQEPAAAKPKEPAPVVLRSSHDYELTKVALEHRAEELGKLSKKNQEEGYVREARAVASDADAIANQILPQFRAQLVLATPTPEDLLKQILGALQVHVFRAFDGWEDAKVKITVEEIQRRRNRLAQQLAERVALYAVDVANAAFDQGYALRQVSAERLAAEKVNTLKAASF